LQELSTLSFSKRNKVFREKKKSETAEVIKETGKSPYRDYPFLVYSFLCTVFAICFFSFSIQSRYFIKMLPTEPEHDWVHPGLQRFHHRIAGNAFGKHC
jgi:hypothetical protein